MDTWALALGLAKEKDAGTIPFLCPTCGLDGPIGREHAGDSVTCRQCSSRIRVSPDGERFEVEDDGTHEKAQSDADTPRKGISAEQLFADMVSVAAADGRVEQVQICTPDKDLGQCVTADARVVQYDRRKRALIDHDGVIEKFGVPPESIPDYLALVGDSADGFPGLKGWGAKSAGAVLGRYPRR